MTVASQPLLWAGFAGIWLSASELAMPLMVFFPAMQCIHEDEEWMRPFHPTYPTAIVYSWKLYPKQRT